MSSYAEYIESIYAKKLTDDEDYTKQRKLLEALNRQNLQQTRAYVKELSTKYTLEELLTVIFFLLGDYQVKSVIAKVDACLKNLP